MIDDSLALRRMLQKARSVLSEIQADTPEAMKERIAELEAALSVAANHLEGVVLAIKAHGTNINEAFFIDHYSKAALEARAVIRAVEGQEE